MDSSRLNASRHNLTFHSIDITLTALFQVVQLYRHYACLGRTRIHQRIDLKQTRPPFSGSCFTSLFLSYTSVCLSVSLFCLSVHVCHVRETMPGFIQCESTPPLRFSKIFPKPLGIFHHFLYTPTLCSEKNTHSHFFPYLQVWCVDLNKNYSEYT